jgi:SPP1 gp7 family putative phage head morphogenesis protein
MAVLSASDPSTARFPWLNDAADFVTQMGIATPESVRKMSDKMAKQTFTMSGVNSIETLYKLREIHAEAIRSGESRAAAARRLNEVADLAKGQAETSIHDTIKSGYVDQWAKTIEKPAVKKVFGYVKYVSTRDGRTRPEHAAMDGFVCSVDDPAYQTMLELLTEPRCRCLIINLTEKQAEKAGIKTASQIPAITLASL